MTNIDVTGFTAVTDLADELESRGAHLVLAGRRTQAQLWAHKRGMTADDVLTLRFPTLRKAVQAYKEAHRVRAPNEGVRPEVVEEEVPVPDR